MTISLFILKLENKYKQIIFSYYENTLIHKNTYCNETKKSYVKMKKYQILNTITYTTIVKTLIILISTRKVHLKYL